MGDFWFNYVFPLIPFQVGNWDGLQKKDGCFPCKLLRTRNWIQVQYTLKETLETRAFYISVILFFNSVKGQSTFFTFSHEM